MGHPSSSESTEQPARVCSWWFEKRSAVAIAFRILKAVADGTFERLVIIPYTGTDGLSHVKFRVVTADQDAAKVTEEPDINESFPCPPFFVPPGSGQCPGGG